MVSTFSVSKIYMFKLGKYTNTLKSTPKVDS